MKYSERYSVDGPGASVDTLETELAAAVSFRDALRNELAGITHFLDRARETAGTEIWWVDLRDRTIACGMENREYALETLIHAGDIEGFLSQVSLASPDCPNIRVELRTKVGREPWENSLFRGRVDSFDADGRPALLVGARTMRAAPSLPERQPESAREVAETPGTREFQPLSDEYLRELLEASFVVFYWIDLSGPGHGYANSLSHEFLSPFRIQSFDQLLEVGHEGVHPDDRSGLIAAEERMFSTTSDHPVRQTFIYRRRHLDGQYRWFYDHRTLLPGKDGAFRTILGSAVDITARKEAESALRATEQRYRLLVKLSKAMIWRMSTDQKFDFVSPAIFEQVGYTPEEFMALSPEERRFPETLEMATALFQGALARERERPGTTPPFRFEAWHRHKNGSRVRVEVAASIMRDDAGRVTGFCGATRDITQAHLMKEALRKSREELEKNVLERTNALALANDALRREIGLRRQVEKALLDMTESEMRSIGHDLHDGLCQQFAGIMCLCQVARERMMELGSIDAIQMGRVHDLLGDALRNVRYMARGMSPLLPQSECLRASLETLADSILTVFKATCRFRATGHSLPLNAAQSLNLYRIAQTAIQIAVRHRKAGHIDITLDTSPERVCLTVENDGTLGAGIASETLDIDLEMIEYRITSMGGTMRIKNHRGGGTTLRCVAPLAPCRNGGDDAAAE